MIAPPVTVPPLVPPSAAYLQRVSHVFHQSLFLLGGIVLSVFLCWVLVFNRRGKQNLPYPPGPKPLPLVGNLFQMNTAEPWLTYTAWKKQYGDLLYIRLFGQSFVILNSEKTARALLDQRSALYSDRPVLKANAMFGMGFSTVTLRYGDEWRLHRKLYQHTFRMESEISRREAYLRRVPALLAGLLDSPAEFELHIKSYVASNIMGLAYGYETAARDDPMVRTVMSLVDIIAESLSPEKSAILSAFPFLEKLPNWLPGSGLWRDAARARELAVQVLDVPFNWVKGQMMAGSAPPSLVADNLAQLDQKDDYDKQEYAIKSTAATAFLAGFETSSSTLHAFILAMLLYPEVQAKARAEIDAVVGRNRLPHFDDRPSLPYVDAILRELVRWNPVIPLGIPHSTSDDDIYNGYHIPKGAFVLINVWAMGRDEDKFTDAEDFKPERFLSEGKLKEGPPMSADPIFGLGRRICPGRFSSEALVWAAVVSILATFHITKARDVNGKEVNVKKRFTTGLAVRPVEFPCWFISRSNEREDTIRECL